MGMFDHLRCHYPLPAHGNACDFQTKDTPAQWLDNYEIRADGSLWHEDYDTEDRSDPNAEELFSLLGCMTRVNKRWTPEPMTGEVRFCSGGYGGLPRYEFSSYFIEGALKHLVTIEAPTGEANE